MRLMAARSIDHARVLNLSDLREPKSPVLMRLLAHLEGVSDGAGHTLFGGERDRELRGLIGPAGRVSMLAGWGRHKALESLAKACVDRFKGWHRVGVPVPGARHLYAHPSPMLQRMKDQWLQDVMAQFP